MFGSAAPLSWMYDKGSHSFPIPSVFIMPLVCNTILDLLDKHECQSEEMDYRKDILLEPFRHIHSECGKGIRDRLMVAFNYWIHVPEDQLNAIAEAVALLHTASLMIDDIEDGSLLRRGVPVAHDIYGIPHTINAANYMYFWASRKLISLEASSNRIHVKEGHKAMVGGKTNPVVNIVTSEILSLHQGQGQEIFWRDNLRCPSEEAYILMVVNKTGGLLRIAIRVMELFAVDLDQPSKFTHLINLIAIYYQIRDDYMNLQSEEYESKKGFADDLAEGKFSFPIIHAIQSDLDNVLLLNILKMRPTDPARKKLAISYLKQKGSFAYTFRVLQDVETLVINEIERLGGNPKLENFVKLIRCPNLHSPQKVNGI